MSGQNAALLPEGVSRAPRRRYLIRSSVSPLPALQPQAPLNDCAQPSLTGGEHVAHPTRTNILNPSEMDDVAADDTCIQCHSQGRPRAGLIDGKAYDWPVGYHVGLHLADYWKLEDSTLGQTDFFHYADGTAHKNRMQGNGFVRSVMYRHGVTCASCHDAHGTDNYAQLRKPADRLCLDCHGAGSPNGPHTATLEEHTHHKNGSSGSSCIACHMPKIETEGVPGSFVRIPSSSSRR